MAFAANALYLISIFSFSPMPSDQLFMQRALDLALLGATTTRPNPMVGCVIVHKGRIIGEGFTSPFGGPHAEVNAINAVADKSLLPEATVYVTLEPCAHFGKTPPCADLLIKHSVKRVVICNPDPNPQVNGGGIQKLQEAKTEVTEGILAEKGRFINRRFFAFQEKQRPYILLKWAQTADGFIARSDFSSKWISGDLSRRLVHKWRTEEQAILVGTGTALHDNPHLTVRDFSGPNPLRIIIDRKLRLPNELRVLDASQPTLVYNQKQASEKENLEFIKLDAGDNEFMQAVLQDLYQRQVQSVLVEGGSSIINCLLSQNLWDEARVFIGPGKFKTGVAAPAMPLHHLRETQQIAEDKLHLFFNEN